MYDTVFTFVGMVTAMYISYNVDVFPVRVQLTVFVSGVVLKAPCF
jgi:hypothetical protein